MNNFDKVVQSVVPDPYGEFLEEAYQNWIKYRLSVIKLYSNQKIDYAKVKELLGNDVNKGRGSFILPKGQ